LPGARHKDAAAVEAHAPTYEQWKAELGDDAVAPRAAVATGASASPSSGASSSSATLTATAARTPPTPEQQAAAVAAARSPQRVIARPAGAAGGALGGAKPTYKDSLESEILVVVSKMKNYVKERADMSTSDSVATVLSDKIRRLCDRAIENARADGRKTVMDRDFR
jgi:histone H3/H4